MKKGFLKAITAGLVVASSVGLAACSSDEEKKNLQYSIYNYDNIYVVNEDFSVKGAKLKIINDDGTETIITLTDSMLKDVPDMSTPGTKTITIVYLDNEFTFTIEVMSASVVSHQIYGYESSYYTNDQFNCSQLRLKLFYDNGSNETIKVTEEKLDAMPDMSTPGTKQINIIHNNINYPFTISVVDPAIVSSSIEGFKESYFVNDEFTLENAKLKINYSNGSQEIVDITEFMIAFEPDMHVAGVKTITVNYKNKRYNFQITVNNPEQINYVVTGYENSYFTTSTFNIDQLKLKVFYNDGSEEEVNITESMISHMPVMTTAGVKTIIVNHNQKQYTFSITVVEPSVLSHTITGYKSSYFTSETFMLNGLKLNLVYNDGISESIDVVPSMIKQIPSLTIPGNKTVVVMYNGNEYQFTIKVVSPKETSRQIVGATDLYDVSDQFDLSSIKLIINYEDATYKLVDITEDMIYEMPDMTTEGIKSIAVNYQGVFTEIIFNVKDLAKAEMMEKIQNFMKDYNSTDVKTSGIKINVEGNAKYLENNVEFKEELYNITVSSLNDLDGYKIYQPNVEAPYVLIKEFASMEELKNDNTYINLIGVNYVVLDMFDGKVERYYGTSDSYTIVENMPEISLDEFMSDALKITQNDTTYKDITIFNSKLAGHIYKAITNAIVNSTMDVKKEDIISARDNLTAQLNIIKTLQNINTNITNIDIYDVFVNNILLTEKDRFYVEEARNYISEIFEITDQNTLDELDYILTNDIKKIRNNQLQDLETIYNMILELNNTLQASNGNASILEKLDIIVSGIDNQDKHMLSKLVYSLKDISSVEQKIYGESEDINYIQDIGGMIYDDYELPDDPMVRIYQYYTYQKVDGSDELVEEYYAGLKSLVERFENIESYTNVKTFASDIIRDLRAMDQVIQVCEENNNEFFGLNYGLTSYVRVAIETYIDMYDSNAIADIIDMLGQAMPEGAKQYEVLSDSMYPELKFGDKITVEAQTTYEVGDIVVFNVSDVKIVHRVIGKIVEGGKTYYICHGDANQSVNTSLNGPADWQDDADYIEGMSISEIQNTIGSLVQIVEETQVEGKVTGVNQLYLELPSNLVVALQDCADTIYLALGKSEIDYIKLIEDLCDRLELEKDYYIEKYKAGELAIFADAFDRYMGDLSEYEGAELQFFTAIKASCNYLDSVLVQGIDRTELMNEINKAVKALHDVYVEMGDIYEYEQMLTDVIVHLTNTENDFNTNFNKFLTEYKTTFKEFLTLTMLDMFNLAENEEAYDELNHINNYYLTAYLKDSLVIGDWISEMDQFINTYCDTEVQTYVKSTAILSFLVMNYGEDIDYNELLGDIELPNEIKDVDFNKLIKETLKDKETYDILDLQDVKVDYITDEEGNITKEILTISLNANYDILLSSMDAKVTLTIEINF